MKNLNTNVKEKTFNQFGKTNDVRKASEIKGCVGWIGPHGEHTAGLILVAKELFV